MARDTWFETVAIAQQRAKKRLPKSAYSSLISASEKGVTVSDNVESFAELGFAPHVVGATEKREMATTVMGQDISMPVIISPTGVQAVDPDGEVAVARAAAAWHRHGAVFLREQANGRSHRRQRQDLLPDLLARVPRRDRRAGAARQGCRGGRTHLYDRLELQPRPRLG